MPSILGRTWTIYDGTKSSPFAAGMKVEFVLVKEGEPSVEVKSGGQSWPGTYIAEQDKVVVEVNASTHWEFVGSKLVNDNFIMHGSSWITSAPDAMGAWVSDPQGGGAGGGAKGDQG